MMKTRSFWDAWIGLIRKVDSKFYWIDDTPLEGSYSAWGKGEPNNNGSNENCVNYYGYNENMGNWNDFPCEGGSNYNNEAPSVLCQKPL